MHYTYGQYHSWYKIFCFIGIKFMRKLNAHPAKMEISKKWIIARLHKYAIRRERPKAFSVPQS